MTRRLRTRILLSALTAALPLASLATAQESSSFAYQSTDGDGRSIELRTENGRVTTARVDGEDIPLNRVRAVEGGFEILGEDGEVVRRISAPRGAETPRAERARPRQREIEIREGAPRDAAAPKAMLGVGLGSPDEALAHHLGIDRTKSTLVTSVMKELPAAKAGIERFDVIVGINGDRNASSESIRRVLRGTEPGTKVSLEIRRGEKTKTVEVEAVPFDGDRLVIETEGMPAMPNWTGDEADGFVLDEDTMFIMGPDGRRMEFRLPGRPGMRMQPEELERRMNEWGEQMERRMRERMDDRRPPQESGQDDRMRRLEERLDQLMRELERDRADRRARKSDA
jgi:PDZ domain